MSISTIRSVGAAATAALLALTPALPAAEASVEDRLAKLEAAIARLESRLGEPAATELAPTRKEFTDLARALAWDGKSSLAAVKPAGKEKSLTLGGFVHANFESGSTAPDARFAGLNSRFLLRRARLAAAGAFAEGFSFKLESDFGNNSISAKTGLAGQLTDAYLAWTKWPAASVRLGQFKTPFGYEQLQSDTKIYTIERSLPNDNLTVSRQIGAMLHGDLADKRIGYALAAYNGNGINVGSNDNQEFLWVGRATAVLADTKFRNHKLKLTAGADYFTTEDRGTFTGRRDGTSFDAQLAYGPAEVQAEWLEGTRDPVTGTTITARGWAVLGAVNLTAKWQGVARFESYDSNTAATRTTTDLWTLGLNYLLKGDDLKLSLNYLTGEPPAPAPRGERLIGRLQVVF